MATNKEYYVTCNGCGVAYVEGGRVVKADSEEDVRGQAEDDGWAIKQGGSNLLDYCPKCEY